MAKLLLLVKQKMLVYVIPKAKILLILLKASYKWNNWKMACYPNRSRLSPCWLSKRMVQFISYKLWQNQVYIIWLIYFTLGSRYHTKPYSGRYNHKQYHIFKTMKLFLKHRIHNSWFILQLTRPFSVDWY